MTRTVPYSALKDDLYYPCKRAEFFSTGLPNTDAKLCVELARLAYCRSKGSFAFDRDRIRQVVSRVGFADCEFIESQTTPDGRGVHAFVALRPDLAVVSFRGTDRDDPTDIGDDVNLRLVPWKTAGLVHCGFSHALDQLLPGVEAALEGIAGKSVITGHSLGAAMAVLLASLHAPSALYTFGCPRVGDADFVATLAAVPHFRYADCCDVVARVPPEALGYSDLGAVRYIDRFGHMNPDPDSGFVVKDRLIAAAEYIEQYAWRSGDVGVRELADHAPVNYVYAIANE